MNKYDELIQKSMTLGHIEDSDIRWILTDPEAELLPILNAAYRVRSKYFGNKVRIHILDNVKSGSCQEDCSYCAQSKKSENKIKNYPLKNRDEILEDARIAFENNAFRYCMVLSGKTLSDKAIDFICSVVVEIKKRYRMEICVSAGFLTEEKALKLKNSGVNRYNHNLNTGKNHYSKICRTHSYEMRLETIRFARSMGLEICSGIIIGMGEGTDDIINIIHDLRDAGIHSIPVNFFLPLKGTRIEKYQPLSPEYCLKILSTFRLCFPETEIRCAGGREYHLRGMQSLCLYPVNSIFAEGYLTTGGDPIQKVKEMILDAGFVVEGVDF